MKRTLVFLFVFFLLVVMAPVVQAQYTVRPGDTLWGLASKNLENATAWEKIYVANSFLHEPGRRFVKNGCTIVLLKPGESLAGLNKIGILVTPLESTPMPTSKPLKPIIKNTTTSAWFGPWLKVVLVTLLVVVLFLVISEWWLPRRKREYQRKLSMNPITSGPPMYNDEVTNEVAQDLLLRQASRLHAERTGELPRPTRVFSVQRLLSGIGWGIVDVLYADGRFEPRRLDGEQVYKGTVRFPDGREENLYMLQGCGNDLRIRRRGEVYFEPEEALIPQPESTESTSESPSVWPTKEEEEEEFEPIPVRDTRELEPDDTGEPVPAGGSATLKSKGRIFLDDKSSDSMLVRVEYRPANEKKPAMISMAGVDTTADITCEIWGNGLQIRFMPYIVNKEDEKSE